MPNSEYAPCTHDDAKISLIVATIGRREELARLLDSLHRQTLPPHEIIIVDQNPAGWLDDILAAHAGILPLRHVHSAKGLSLARNIGLGLVTGDIVGFPDDDCWYPPSVLWQLSRYFADSSVAGICLPLCDDQGRATMVDWPSNDCQVNRKNIWSTCVSPGLFVRSITARANGHFDTNLGVGASTPWGSGEETDWVLRMLKSQLRILFFTAPLIGHPARPPSEALIARAAAYGRGLGYVWAIHRLPKHRFLYHCARAFAGCLRGLLRWRKTEAIFYFRSLKGRCQGYRDGRRAVNGGAFF